MKWIPIAFFLALMPLGAIESHYGFALGNHGRIWVGGLVCGIALTNRHSDT